MESKEQTISVDGIELLRSATAAMVFYSLDGRNFAGEENRGKSYSQHLVTLDFQFNGDQRRVSFAPGTSLQLLEQDGTVRDKSAIAHHANLAEMPVEMILPQAYGLADYPDGWALFIADEPLSGHFSVSASDGRHRAGVRWGCHETEDFLLFNAAAAGARLQVVCTRTEVAKVCLLGREDGEALQAMPEHAIWEAIAEDRKRLASLPYGEVMTLLSRVRNKVRKVA